MKIAVNTRFLIKDKLEGIGWFTYEVMKRLVLDHPEHTFYFLFDRPFHKDFIFASNVKGLVVPPPARHPILWLAWFELALPRVLRRLKPDVFLSPDGYLSLKATTPTLMVTHDIAHVHHPGQLPFLVRKYYRHFVPRYLVKARHVITVSDFCRRDIISCYGIDGKKITVAVNGAREVFHPLTFGEKEAVRKKYAKGSAYFFYMGSLHPRKNVSGLIRAFNLFKEQTASPVKLLVGGRFAWHTGPIGEAYGHSPWKKDISFLGYLPEEELARLLGAALALTYVSHFEGFGLPILEAMQAETPVITSNVSSMPEIAGNAALLVDPGDPAAIAHAMASVYEDATLQGQLIERGKEQRKRFNWELTAQIIWNELEKIVPE